MAEATLPPTEILICQDGPLEGLLAEVVRERARQTGARVVVNPGPRGLHHNLNNAARDVRTPWIARMDADDVSLPHRFEAQVRFLLDNPRTDALGGAILEVWPDGRHRRRSVPQAHADIVRRSRWRSPMNHMTMFFRTGLLRDCGGYPDIFQKEDYALWLRMLKRGAIFANLADDLVRVRVGEGFYKRRTGVRNFATEWALYRIKREDPQMGGPLTAVSLLARAAALSLTGPARLLYEHVLR